MPSPKKTHEITKLLRELADRGLVFYVTASNTRLRSGPDIILPENRIAVWMQRENPFDGHNLSKGQAAQHAALRAAGWSVVIPYGHQDALKQCLALAGANRGTP